VQNPKTDGICTKRIIRQCHLILVQNVDDCEGTLDQVKVVVRRRLRVLGDHLSNKNRVISPSRGEKKYHMNLSTSVDCGSFRPRYC
jgi:hypothetical protein